MGRIGLWLRLARSLAAGYLALACGGPEVVSTAVDDSNEDTNGVSHSGNEASEGDSGALPQLAELSPDEQARAYCARTAALYCGVLNCCSPTDQACPADMEERCLESHQLLHQMAQVKLDTSAADVCIAELEKLAQACEVPEQEPNVCARIWVGTSAPGQACNNDISCAPQSDAAVLCALSEASSAGTCLTVPWLAEGDACEVRNDGQCSAGLFCSDATRRCEPKRPLGSTCSVAYECGSGECLSEMCVQESFEDVCESLSPPSSL